MGMVVNGRVNRNIGVDLRIDGIKIDKDEGISLFDFEIDLDKPCQMFHSILAWNKKIFWD